MTAGQTANLNLKFNDSTHNTDKYSGVNAKLKYVSCNHSNVTEIDLTGCPEVTYLNCSDNYGLSTLELTKNPKLEYLYCSNINLAVPDLSENTELRVLDCSYKQDINNTDSGVFNPSNSPAVTNLDLTKNAKLEYLDCSGNTALTELKLASDFSDTQYLKGNALEYIDCH